MTYTSDASYTVQSDDTLYLIAERLLGDGNRWTEIKNPDGSSPIPTQLQIGQELVLPSSKGTSAPSGGTGQNAFAQEILAAHNRYRAEVGAPPLQWSDQLASDAQGWANHLASLGQGLNLIHSQNTGQGENLWGGTSGAFNPTQMVDNWGSEKAAFAPGPFTGAGVNGGVVGHYTQMIWKDTTQVGCAIASGGGNDYLVCRYTPQGNMLGQQVP